MDFGASAAAAGLVGVALGLVRVVEYLIKRRNGKNGHGSGGLSKEQADHLEDVAKWAAKQELEWSYVKRDILSVKDEASSTNKKIDVLVSSQQRLVDRIGDFIVAIEKDRSR